MLDRPTLRAAEKAMDIETALRQVLAVALAEKCGSSDEDLLRVRSWYVQPELLPLALQEVVEAVSDWRTMGLWPLTHEQRETLSQRHSHDLLEHLEGIAQITQPPGWD